MSSRSSSRGLRGPGQEVEIEVPTDDRRHRQHPPGVLPQSPDPRPDHHAHAVGQGHLLQRALGHPSTGGVLVDRPGLRQVAQHLGHEERVAVGLPVHGMGEAHPGGVEALTGGGLQERHHAAVVESGQFDAGDAALAMQRGQGVGEGVGL